MTILYIGDIMGDAGIEVVEKVLPKLRSERNIDLVIAQGENVTAGKGISLADFQRVRKAGVDFCSGGNHMFAQQSILGALSDPAQPIIRPANYPMGTPGLGYKYIGQGAERVLVVSLLGQIVGKQSAEQVDNPLRSIDRILKTEADEPKVATIVNFHGDFSSEKVIIGAYLDGKVTAVIGDHWHIPTADARVQPKGTAHITDVGMCGALHSSLGVSFDSVIPRWRDEIQTRNALETEGPRQFNAVLIESDDNGLATSIEQIRQIL